MRPFINLFIQEVHLPLEQEVEREHTESENWKPDLGEIRDNLKCTLVK